MRRRRERHVSNSFPIPTRRMMAPAALAAAGPSGGRRDGALTPMRAPGARGRTLALVFVCFTLLAAGAPGIADGQGTPMATPHSAGGDWSEDAVCYEVFVRSFADSDGDGIGDLV